MRQPSRNSMHPQDIERSVNLRFAFNNTIDSSNRQKLLQSYTSEEMCTFNVSNMSLTLTEFKLISSILVQLPSTPLILALNSTDMCTLGVSSLVSAIHNKKIYALDISHNRIQDLGARTLVTFLQNNQYLGSLRIHSNLLSKETAKDVNQAIKSVPNLLVAHYFYLSQENKFIIENRKRAIRPLLNTLQRYYNENLDVREKYISTSNLLLIHHYKHAVLLHNIQQPILNNESTFCYEIAFMLAHRFKQSSCAHNTMFDLLPREVLGAIFENSDSKSIGAFFLQSSFADHIKTIESKPALHR